MVVTDKALLISFIMVILPVYEHQVGLILNLEQFKNFRPGKIGLMVRKKL